MFFFIISRGHCCRSGRAAHAEKVILFGSHVHGGANPESDVDFLIIAESALPRHKRSRELYQLFRPYPFAMDILVYTPGEIEAELKSPVTFISTILKKGLEIYAA